MRFSKMHGAGNDFVVIDCTRQSVRMTPTLARAIADRHRGIGCDQILLVQHAEDPSVDFAYRIFNADGSEVEQCGNGARCFVRFVHDTGLTTRQSIRVKTLSGVITPSLEADGRVTVDMGAPRFAPKTLPFDAYGLEEAGLGTMRGWKLEVAGHMVTLGVVSMGNPHAVQFVANVDDAPVAALGPLIEAHPRFPARVNAGFVQCMDRHHARLRVYERGAGETLSCGTGACAATVLGIRAGWLDSPVDVATRGGTLTIAWSGDQNPVLMTGPATMVFHGEIDLDALLAAA